MKSKRVSTPPATVEPWRGIQKEPSCGGIAFKIHIACIVHPSGSVSFQRSAARLAPEEHEQGGTENDHGRRAAETHQGDGGHGVFALLAVVAEAGEQKMIGGGADFSGGGFDQG